MGPLDGLEAQPLSESSDEESEEESEGESEEESEEEEDELLASSLRLRLLGGLLFGDGCLLS